MLIVKRQREKRREKMFYLTAPSLVYMTGQDSSVGIATRYVLDGTEIETRLGKNYLYPSRQDLGPTQPPLQWVPDLFRG
jgi:hypothetical protein